MVIPDNKVFEPFALSVKYVNQSKIVWSSPHARSAKKSLDS